MDRRVQEHKVQGYRGFHADDVGALLMVKNAARDCLVCGIKTQEFGRREDLNPGTARLSVILPQLRGDTSSTETLNRLFVPAKW